MAYYKKDQLSIKTRTLLADYFADLVLISQSVESFRWALAQTQYFNGIQLFRYLDKDEKGYLTPKDFALVISDEVKKILHYAFAWFDSSKAGQITRVQFLQFLFPRQNSKLRQLVSIRMQQEITPQQKQISIPMQLDLLRSLILQIMERQTKLIPARRILMDQDDYTIKAVMNCLDAEGRGWVTADDFYKFMKNYDIDVSIGSVCGLLGIYDNDMNGKISLSQLEWFVEGLQRTDGEYRNIVRNSDRKAKNKRLNSCCTCNRSSKKSTHSKFKKQVKTTNKKIQKQNRQQEQENKSLTKHNNKNKKQNKVKLQKRLNFDQSSGKKKFKNQNAEESNFLNTLETKKGNKNRSNYKLQKIYEKSQYESLKKAFQLIQLQTIQIDQELKKYEQQMGLQTQLQMEKKLQIAIINRRVKMEQQSRLKRRIQQLYYLRKQQQLKRLQQIQALRLQQMQNNRMLQAEVQRNRMRALQNEKKRQIEETRRRQVEIQNIKLRQLENARTRELENIRLAQIREEQDRMRAIEIQRIRQRQIQNTIVKNNMQRQIYDREIRNVRLMQSQFDWRAEEKLKALHDQQVRQRSLSNNKSIQEKQYFWRYNNYCQNFAQVADPLGIKQHLAQTQKYLLKSRQIRDQIKKDRVNSLNRYSTSNLKKSKNAQSKVNTQNDEPIFERTPYQNKNVIDSAKKWTKQTKLMWS